MSKMKISPTPPQPTVDPSAGDAALWSGKKRLIVSVLLLLHISAVFVAPWAGPPPASELSGHVARWLEPYLFSAYLNHGYRFFAPNPGPSHLVRYEIEKEDGTIFRGKFPDLQKHRPRLLYHRYLMLSETIYNLSNIPEYSEKELLEKAKHLAAAAQHLRSAGDLERAAQLMQEAEQLKLLESQPKSGPEYEFYQRALRQKQVLLSAIAQDLLRKYRGKMVNIFLVEHAIPDPEDVLQGMRLTDKRLYQERPLGEFFKETQK